MPRHLLFLSSSLASFINSTIVCTDKTPKKEDAARIASIANMNT